MTDSAVPSASLRPGAHRATRLRVAAAWGVAWFGALALLPAHLLAAGFEIPDNGAKAISRGSAFTVRADDLTAMAHNPAGLLKARDLRRTRGAGGSWHALQTSHNLIYAPMTFQRAESSVPQVASNDPGSTDPLAKVENETPWFAKGGSLFYGTDLGLDDFAFALGVYGPNAAGHQKYPVTGGPRWMLVELDALIVYYSAAIAYGKRDTWGVGLTLQLAHQPMTKMSLVIDGTPGGEQSPYYAPTDVLATLSMSATPVPTAIFGAWWRPIEALEFGVSGRFLPVKLAASGDIGLTNTPGGSQFTPAQLEVEGGAARLTLTIPPTARAGVRYRHMDGATERFDVELDVVWEGWSMMKEYKVELDGLIKLFAATEAPDVVISKRWRDTLSLRLGGTYNLDGLPLSLSAGGFYESAAVPNNYSHLDFPSFMRIGVAAGASGRLFGNIDWVVGYSHIFQESRTVSELFGKVLQQRPVAECPTGCDGFDSIPANAGVFSGSYDIVTASLAYTF